MADLPRYMSRKSERNWLTTLAECKIRQRRIRLTASRRKRAAERLERERLAKAIHRQARRAIRERLKEANRAVRLIKQRERALAAMPTIRSIHDRLEATMQYERLKSLIFAGQ
jgi:hypothetical protein